VIGDALNLFNVDARDVGRLADFSGNLLKVAKVNFEHEKFRVAADAVKALEVDHTTKLEETLDDGPKRGQC